MAEVFVGGERLDLPRLERWPVIDPATGEEVDTFPLAGPEEVDAAVTSARDAFPAWRDTPAAKRGELLGVAAHAVLGAVEELAPLLTSEQGKPLREARLEIRRFVHTLEHYAGLAKNIRGGYVPDLDTGTYGMIVRRPLGVIGAIVPWNFPTTLLGNKLGPALITGNTLVAKPAETTPLTTLRVAQIMHEAGLPEGVFNVVTGTGEGAGQALVEHPLVRKVAFTGSTPVGKELMALAANDLKRATLELGGSDPMIVCDDANLDRAASAASVGRFFNCGQACLVVKRVYVFVGKLRVGPGTAEGAMLGPLHSRKGRDLLEEQVGDAVDSGAEVLHGAKVAEGRGLSERGNFYEPTLLLEPSRDSRVATEEVFGPALPVWRVGGMEEALELANSTVYGLGSSVWTADLNRASEAAERIEAGYTWINSPQVVYDELPFMSCLSAAGSSPVTARSTASRRSTTTRRPSPWWSGVRVKEDGVITVPEWFNASTILDNNLEAGRAEKVAIYCGDDEVTYGELARRANRFGHALKDLGVGQEDRVVLVLNDTPSFPVAFFGAMRIGAVPIPTNTLLGPGDYRFFVENSRARVVVADEMHHETLIKALEGYKEPVEVILTNVRAEGVKSLEDLLGAGEDDLSPVVTHRDDPAFWLYSSGSTGRPKGAVHLHHDINYTCETYARHVLEVSEDDVCFSASKLFHAYGLGNNISFPYWAGASTVLYPGKPLPEAILGTAQRYRPTLFYSVPTAYNAMLNHKGAAEYDLSSIRLCVSAAEALPAGIWRRWKETFGLTILDGIGSTEMLHIFVSNTPEKLKPGSSGVPVPGYEARILDENEQPVERGEAGYLSVRGDSAAAYYWRNHEKSKATMRGEWTFAGDWYRVDEDGFYWYEGRSDDMIKVSGLWVSPVEVESTLGDHPAVNEAAAVGVAVDDLTRVRAHVVLREGYEPSEELVAELQNWCKERLKRYQYPHFVRFVEELPKTVTGKIQRFKLREPETQATMPQQEDELV